MQNMIRTALPPSEDDPSLDDPIGLFGLEEESFITEQRLDRLGCKTYELAYKKLKNTVGAQAINRFIKKRSGPGRVMLEDELDYQHLIHGLIGCRAGREMVQNAVREKLVRLSGDKKRKECLSVLIEYQILRFWLDHREGYNSAIGVNTLPSEMLEKRFRLPHPFLTAFSACESLSSEFRPTYPGYVFVDLIDVCNAPILDTDHYFLYDSAIQTQHRASIWSLASLYRSRMVWESYRCVTEYDTPTKPAETDGESISDAFNSHGGIRLLNHQFRVQVYWGIGERNQAARFAAETSSVIEAIDQAHVRRAIQLTKSDADTLLARLQDSIRTTATSLGVDGYLKKWISALERLIASLDALPERFDPQADASGLVESLDAVRDERLAPLASSLDKLTAIHESAKLIEEAQYSTLVERMEATKAVSERLEAWRSEYEQAIGSPDLPPIEAPASPEPLVAAPSAECEESNDTSEPDQTPLGNDAWSDEDLSQVLEDNERLKAERSALNAQIESLQQAINHPERTGMIDPDRVQRAFLEHISTSNRVSALALLEAIYPDRIRVLDSAWEALEEHGEGITAGSITNKLTPLTTTALDAFRAGKRHIEINDLIAGEIRFNESDTVLKNERLRRLRDFRDGSETYTMYWHLSLDHGHRVYFDYSETESRILIGYLGKHLPSARARTV